MTNAESPEYLVAQISALMERLAHGPVAVTDQALAPEQLLALGFELQGGQIRLRPAVELLDKPKIQAALSQGAQSWLTQFHLPTAIDSTNTWMMEGLAGGKFDPSGLDGRLAMAECQVAGRGRRGRTWLSPLGSNLAVSCGFRLEVPIAELGGLSLVVGMAVVDALDPQGQFGLSLKWPNDVLLGGRKLCGILVEVAQRNAACEVCVGVGVNWQIPEEVRKNIDQSVAEVADFAPQLGRNQGASLLISQIVRFVQAFAAEGFGAMRDHYDNIHAFHGETCRILGPQGDIEGKVLGVTDAGELRLETLSGEQIFSSGEVSLRKQ